MGERPIGMTIERIDNNKGYQPDNCRWATKTEQTRNRVSNLIIEFRGQKMCVVEWAEFLGIAPHVISLRLRYGWDIQKALTTPVRKRRSNGDQA